MKAMILAAGRGSRLGRLTNECPKCLIEVAGKPILVRQLELLQELGVKETVVVTGYRRRDVERVVRAFPSACTVHNPFWPLTNVIGSAWIGLQSMGDSLLYLHGDTLVERPILDAVLRSHTTMLLPYDGHACADEEMKIRLDGGSLVEISKTMDPGLAAGEFLGVCSIHADFLPVVKQAVDEELADQRFQGFFEAAIQRLIDCGTGPIEVVDISGQFWREIDTPHDLAVACAHYAAV